jgi:hypothetical protein
MEGSLGLEECTRDILLLELASRMLTNRKQRSLRC